jgi:NAD(P)-dependent dehydrogenase (short-subunit alcohol dehydrogenase family)
MKRRSTASSSARRTSALPWHNLAGKRIWVTGGAGHLGSPITIALDQAGARVLCIDLGDRAEALIRSARLKNTRAASWTANEATEIPEEVERLSRKHGAPDGFVHLAYASSSGKRFGELSAAEFQSTLDRSLPTTFALCRAVAQAMGKSGRGGSVVLFSSMYGMVAPDPRNYPKGMAPNPIDYGASKAALQQMSRYMAAHYGPAGIRFNCVVPGPFPNPVVQKNHPGFVRTLAGRTALRRVGRHDETVGPTLFLLTDSAAFVTGHSLVVDGGWMAW